MFNRQTIQVTLVAVGGVILGLMSPSRSVGALLALMWVAGCVVTGAPVMLAVLMPALSLVPYALPLAGSPLTPYRVAAALCAVYAVLALVRHSRALDRGTWGVRLLALPLFLGYAALNSSLLRGFGSAALNISAVDQLVLPIAVFGAFVAASSTASNNWFKWVFGATVFTAASASVLGLVQAFTRTPVILWTGIESTRFAQFGGVFRAFGTFQHPIVMGEYVSAVIPGIIAYALVSGQPRARRLLLLAVGALVSAGLVVTGSRGPMLGALSGIAVAVLVAHSYRKRVAGILLMVLAGGTAVLASLPNATEAFLLRAGSSTSLVSRLYLWTSALQAGARSPVLGLGYGGFMQVMASIGGPVGAAFAFQAVDNYYIKVFAELGLVGVILFGLLCAVELTGVVRLARRKQFDPVAFACVGGLTSIAVSSLSSDALTHTSVLILFSLFFVGLESCLANGSPGETGRG